MARISKVGPMLLPARTTSLDLITLLARTFAMDLIAVLTRNPPLGLRNMVARIFSWTTLLALLFLLFKKDFSYFVFVIIGPTYKPEA